MQTRFVFVDTEANIQKVETTQYQTFRLGACILWDRENDHKKDLIFHDPSKFWSAVEGFFDESHHKVLLFAHNMGYDIRLLDGVRALQNRGWTNVRYYVKDKVFILEYTKGKDRLCLWDTFNYVQASLAELGQTVGLEKSGVFDQFDTTEELAEYCLNDTEIIYRFIRNMTIFLEKYQLSKLLPTAGSLSLNIFRHRFYDRKKQPIYIHDWKNAIKLERASYMGGLVDCFRVGDIKEHTYKLDINSMYPSIMLERDVPVKLVFYSKNKADDLLSIYNAFKKDHLVIAKCKVRIPEDFAYIMSKMTIGNEEKTVLAYGSYEVVKCSPELEFIEEHGEILHISELAVYEKANVFHDFVHFFYDRRLEYKKVGDLVNEKFTKIILNSLYGKWGQRSIAQTELTPGSLLMDQYQNILETQGNVGELIDAESDKHYNFVDIGGRIFSQETKEENSKDSFVAIASFITSYARMLLVKYLLQAGRENVWYCDTDSLFVNEEGYQRLQAHVDHAKLGFLKNEGTAEHVIINKPKDYKFGNERKLKGVRKGSQFITADNKTEVYIQDRWEGFSTALRRGRFDTVMVETFEKRVNMIYDKGVIACNNRVRPYRIEQ
jgi:DNA polymerase elongation subunit (family B)